MSLWKALIPIRSGSKSIPDKNIKLFYGKPLFYWATQAAIDSQIFNGGVYVASDSEQYLNLVREWTPAAIPVLRSSSNATDNASSESVVEWFLEKNFCDVISLVQVTTPTVFKTDFINAREKFELELADSLVTTVPFKRFLWSESGNPLNYDPRYRPRRQEMLPLFLENGSFYYTKTGFFKKNKCRLGGKICVFEMSEDTMIEIDEPEDWENAEKILIKRNREYSFKKKPKIVVVDVDGTLTDGGMFYDKDGEVLKKFNTRDGAALNQLKEIGLNILICSGEDSPAVRSRISKLKIANYLPGVHDKKEIIGLWLKNNGFNWDEVLYIGDELNDLEAMMSSAFSVCPYDAHPSIKEIASYIVPSKGGEGVIRDVFLWVQYVWSLNRW